MALALPDGFSQGFQKTKDFVTETAGKAGNPLTEATEQAKISLGKTAETAKEAIAQTTNTAVNSVNQVANQAVGAVAQSTEKAKTSLSEAASFAVNSVSETTSKAVGAVSQTTENAKAAIAQTTNSAVSTINQVTTQTKASLDATIQRAEELNRSVSQGMQGAINSYFNDFIHQHPVLYWIFTHPLQTLVIFILFVILLGGLLKAVATSSEKFWSFLLKSPVKLIIGLFGWGFNFLRPDRISDTITGTLEESLNKGDRQNRLGIILNRLDAIKQEQEGLLQELSALIKSSEDMRVK